MKKLSTNKCYDLISNHFKFWKKKKNFKLNVIITFRWLIAANWYKNLIKGTVWKILSSLLHPLALAQMSNGAGIISDSKSISFISWSEDDSFLAFSKRSTIIVSISFANATDKTLNELKNNI